MGLQQPQERRKELHYFARTVDAEEYRITEGDYNELRALFVSRDEKDSYTRLASAFAVNENTDDEQIIPVKYIVSIGKKMEEV